MQQLYDAFYRRYGIRKANQLLSPPLGLLDLLELPRASIFHCTAVSPLSIGPSSDEFLFRNITRPIMMSHIVELGDHKGMPRRMTIDPNSLIRKYHIKNRRYRMVRDLETGTRDPQTLMVYNYGTIPHLYKYVRSVYTEYHKWWNMEAAVWKNIAEIAGSTSRQHFVLCKLPQVIPTISDLRMASGAITQKTVRIFDSPESLMLLELWKWFGEERKDSLLNLLPEKHFDNINLIFQDTGKWFVVNLGRLNSWRKATKEELEVNPNGNKNGLEAQQLQRGLLRVTMALAQTRVPAEVLAQTVSDAKGVDGKAQQAETTVVKQDTPPSGEASVKTTEKPLPEIAKTTVQEDEPDDTLDDVLKSSDIHLQIEQDLHDLEQMVSNVRVDKDEVLPTELPKHLVTEEYAPERGVKQVCDRLADIGMISAAEYKRYQELANSYKTIVSPDGKTTLEEYRKIKPETIELKEDPVLKGVGDVFDASMTKSSLAKFDSNYIKNVMQKDVANMVLGVQDAGIAVTGYEVEKEEDIMGSSHNFTIKVNPVEGAASTIRFKLPVLDEEGIYTANGVKYRMRKQRGDLPIRKISPNSVALTSYYGKTFVNRSEKKVNDYTGWINNNITLIGLDMENDVVTNIQPSNVFDNTFKAPRLYSGIAQNFRGFTLQAKEYPRSIGRIAFELIFDHKRRLDLYGKEVLQEFETEGAIVVGKDSAGKWFLVMDIDGMLYVSMDGRLEIYGMIETLLGIPPEKAPVDFAELKVMGKNIPIGFVLGYELGLENLFKLLNVVPRRVPVGTRASVASNEYSLVFSDETLVFSKEDKKAAMVLAGFNEYHRAIKSHSVYDFDRRDVYLNVLETSGINVRYLREVDLMYQMFIDSITRELLVKLSMPTEFRGLLLKSCELLLTDDHPDELDPAYMRIKGYERMAGAVYSELVKAIRTQRSTSGKNRNPIDVHPYAVWKTIAQDPAISLVNEINPVQNLKELEAVTFNGVGGRNARSMVKHTRAYHKNDMGTISESTIDSGDVGINFFTSANPQFDSLRGTSKPFDMEKSGTASLLSNSALLSPGATSDDK